MKKLQAYFWCLLSFALLFSIKGQGQDYDYKENAVYIYNFIKYTNFPANKTSYQIGILGNSPVEDELKNLFAKKKNNNLSYTVKKINVAEAKTVDVIIIAKSASDHLKTINKATEGLPILIITEKENLSRFGACISFFIDEDNDFKTVYQLSLRNCKARGLIVNEQIQNNGVLIK